MVRKKIKAIATHVATYLQQGVDPAELEADAKEQGITDKEWHKVIGYLQKGSGSKFQVFLFLVLLMLNILGGYLLINSFDISEAEIEDQALRIALIDQPIPESANAWYDLHQKHERWWPNLRHLQETNPQQTPAVFSSLSNEDKDQSKVLYSGMSEDIPRILQKGFQFPNEFWSSNDIQQYQPKDAMYYLSFVTALRIHSFLEAGNTEEATSLARGFSKFSKNIFESNYDLTTLLILIKMLDHFGTDIVAIGAQTGTAFSPEMLLPLTALETIHEKNRRAMYTQAMPYLKKELQRDSKFLSASPFHFQTNRTKRIIADMILRLNGDTTRSVQDRDIQNLVEKGFHDTPTRDKIKKKALFSRNGLGRASAIHTGVTNASYHYLFENYILLSQFQAVNLALNNYYLDQNEYPESLDALVPQYIAEIPTCPVSNEKMKYHPQAKILYTNGDDNADNGGVDSFKLIKKREIQDFSLKSQRDLKDEISDLVYVLKTVE